MYKWDGRPLYPVGSYHHYRENMKNKCHKKPKCEDKHEDHKHDEKCKKEKKTFVNPTAITITDNAIAAPYPSPILVSGLKGCIKHVTVKLRGFTHTNPSDVHILLASPKWRAVYLLGAAGNGQEVSNINITFDDCAKEFLPGEEQLKPGTYKPSVYDVDLFPPATLPNLDPPPIPYVNALSHFNGEDPNGTWRLYVMDNVATNEGSIADGWSLTICTDCDCKCGCDSKKEK